MFRMFSKLLDCFVKYRNVIMSLNLALICVCFAVFFAFVIVDNDMCYIPLLFTFVFHLPNMFYLLVDELEENNKKEK